MTERRIWPALVLALFCLPLYIGLGGHDLFGDEAGHSFSVARILETGDWLIPKANPGPNDPFLEKPPLKFWLVAAGINAGLPLNEFGLRFWDPVFAGIAFLYLIGIGRRLGHPLCGVFAALILFVHGPLVTDRGLRGNNMEAALVATYCAGVYHFLRWTESDDDVRARRGHAVALCVWFAIGFMVKFVAAAFLPMVVGVSSLVVPVYRTRLFRDWRLWIGAIGVALVLITPWFAYCTWVFGRQFWDIIFGAHVYTRLTSYLDPSHLQPWNFYLVQIWTQLRSSNTWWLVEVGTILLVIDAVRFRRAATLVVLLWFALPIAVMSLTTSKLYHYAFPYLPPVALAGGYVAAFLWNTVQPWVEAAVTKTARVAATGQRTWLAAGRHPVVRTCCLAVVAVSAVVMVWTLVNGRVVLRYGDVTLLKNSSFVRPAVVSAVMLLIGGWPEAIGRFGVPVALVAIAPLDAYRSTIEEFGRGRLVIPPALECVLKVGAQPAVMANGPRGMYVDGPGRPDAFETPFNLEAAYYFRAVRPWVRPTDVTPAQVSRYLFDPAEARPLLISEARYSEILAATPEAALSPPPVVVMHDAGMLVLPGPYGVCGPEVKAARSGP